MTNDELRKLAEAAREHVCTPKCIDPDWDICPHRKLWAEITEERIIALLAEVRELQADLEAVRTAWYAAEQTVNRLIVERRELRAENERLLDEVRRAGHYWTAAITASIEAALADAALAPQTIATHEHEHEIGGEA